MARTVELSDRIDVPTGGTAATRTISMPSVGGRILSISIRKEGSVASIPGSYIAVAYITADQSGGAGQAVLGPGEVDAFPGPALQRQGPIPYHRHRAILWGGQNNSGTDGALLLQATVEVE